MTQTRLTPRQRTALVDIERGATNFVSLNVANALEAKGLVSVSAVRSATGRATHWNATITRGGRAWLAAEARWINEPS